MNYVGGQDLANQIASLVDPTLTVAERRQRINDLEAAYRPMTLRDLIPLATYLVTLGNHDCLSTILKYFTGDSRHGSYNLEHDPNPSNPDQP